jgi:hypothetical protein
MLRLSTLLYRAPHRIKSAGMRLLILPAHFHCFARVQGRCAIPTPELLEHAATFTTDSIELRDASGELSGTMSVDVSFQQEGVAFAFPSPVAASAASAFEGPPPDDAGTLELARDALLWHMGRPIFGVITAVFILGVSAFIVLLLMYLPMLMGFVQWGALGWGDASTEQEWWVTINQCLTALFSYLNLITLPWRLSCAVHLNCSSRNCQSGFDFFGRPTEAPFFHIPVRARRNIIWLLLSSNGLHYASQAMRIAFPTYDTAEKPPGQLLILGTFVPSILCGHAAALLQVRAA